MDSEFRSSAIKGAKVLMVGAGGIGCELLKTLALSGFQDIHIIDMDTIEVSNLNRQFLFRKSHIGQSKARVASDAVLEFRPNISITPYHANVKDPEFNVDFFKKFGVVLNALDNVDARRHVNRLCLAAGVPLIDSGTTGFLGQVSVHVKGKTECYECHPKPVPKSYPVCTITSTPSKFVHCVVWAKDLLFAKLFGDRDRENDLNSAAETTADVFERGADEDSDAYGRRIYDHVFGYNTEQALSAYDGMPRPDRPRPTPLYSRDVLTGRAVNGGRSPHGVSAAASLGLRNPQDVWCLVDSSEVFLVSLRMFLDGRRAEIGSLCFDKEDELSVEFVTAAANVRASSFGIPMCSAFDTKGIAGNIVHAVATTNAVVAGLVVIEAVKALSHGGSHRMTYCLQHPNRKMLLMPVEPFEPNASCYVCSKTPVSLEMDTRAVTFGDFVEKVVRGKLGMSSPLVMHGSSLLYETGDDLEEDLVANYESNLKKSVHEVFSPVAGHVMMVTVEDLYQELSCVLNIKHGEVAEIVMSGLAEALGGGRASPDDDVIDDGEKKRKLLEADIVDHDFSKKQKVE